MEASLSTCFQMERAVASVVLDKVANVNCTTYTKIQLQLPVHPTLRVSLRFKSDKVEAVKDQPRLFAHLSSLMQWLHPLLWLLKNLKCGGVAVENRCKSYKLPSCSLEITIRRHLRVVEHSQERLVHAPSLKLTVSKVWAKLKSMIILHHPLKN